MWFALLLAVTCLSLVLLLAAAFFSLFWRSGSNWTGAVVQPTCASVYADRAAAVEASLLPCCCSLGTLTANRYYPALDLVLSPAPSANPLSVCVGYCPGGYDSATGSCEGGEGTDLLEQCLTLLTPTGCSGLSVPLAAAGSVLYYAFAVGRSGICSPPVSPADPSLFPGTCISDDPGVCTGQSR